MHACFIVSHCVGRELRVEARAQEPEQHPRKLSNHPGASLRFFPEPTLDEIEHIPFEPAQALP